ncbi:MAG: hypothetical protein ACPG5T_03555 [Endozoicomonas sp.]
MFKENAREAVTSSPDWNVCSRQYRSYGRFLPQYMAAALDMQETYGKNSAGEMENGEPTLTVQAHWER